MTWGRACARGTVSTRGVSLPNEAVVKCRSMLRRNVLIFHAGALGDFVLSWPLALALGRLYPQSRVIYVTAGQKGALAERVLRVDSTDIESGWHEIGRAHV